MDNAVRRQATAQVSSRLGAEEFLERFRPTAYRLAVRILHDPDLAEDAVQEALLRAFRSWDRYARQDFELAWVRRILIRAAIDRVPSQQPIAVGEETGDPISTGRDCEVRTVLATLSPEHQTILALSLGEGWSYREIAESLEIPIGTVGSRVHAAKAAFRAAWGEGQ